MVVDGRVVYLPLPVEVRHTVLVTVLEYRYYRGKIQTDPPGNLKKISAGAYPAGGPHPATVLPSELVFPRHVPPPDPAQVACNAVC